MEKEYWDDDLRISGGGYFFPKSVVIDFLKLDEKVVGEERI